MKRLTCIFLIFVLALQTCVVSVFAQTKENSEYWNTMKAFGVIEDETNGEDTFTIADLSRMLYSLLNPGSSSIPEATHQIYTDVDRWHWAAGYIEWLYNNRVYTGDGSGVFEPDRNAKLSDICLAAVNLLGYLDIKEDVEVIKKATQIGLLSSNVTKTEHEITYDEFASICYELLFADIVEPIFSTNKTYKRGEEFISEVLNLQYDKGVVLGANGYSLNSNYCNLNNIIIDNRRYDVLNGSDYTNYIGYSVKYYYDSEKDFVIAVVPTGNKELTIKSTDIISYKNGTYTYEENDHKKTKTGDKALLLYNGKITTNRNAFIPKYGQIRLIDNDSDGKFECVISEDAVNIVLERVVDGIIYGKNEDINDKKYVIDTKELELCKFVGNTVPIEELKEDTVISTVISEDGKYGCFYVAMEKKTGMLEGIDSDSFCIDGNKYKKAGNLYNPGTVASSGCDVEVYIDIYGNIASIIYIGENKYLFGYLISIKEDREEEKLRLKVLTQEGGMQKLYTADKLIIDGGRMTTIDSAASALSENELIRYRLSDGEVKYIDTAAPISGFSEFKANPDMGNRLTMIAKGDNMLYKSSPQIFKNYNDNSMDVYAEFAVNDETYVFFVPDVVETAEDKDYYAGDKSLLYDDMLSGVQAYITDSDALFAKAVVVRYKTQVLLSTKFTIIDNIITTINSDNEIVWQINGLSNGKKVSAVVSDASLLEGVGKGSIIRYATDKNGEIKAINNIYGPNGGGNVNTSATHSWTSGSSGVNANVRVVVGNVYQREGTIARFQFKDNASKDEIFNLKNCNIYVYDKSEKEPIRSGSIDDLYDYKHYGSNCDEVIICTRAVNVSDVFIIKK